MVELRLEHVAKMFSPTIAALDDISMTLKPGECLALLGASGCGKTTLLRVIAGLESVTSGHIFFDGLPMEGVPCHLRDVAMLFQRPALIPNQSVRQNLYWPFALRSWPFFRADAALEAELQRIASVLGLQPHLDRPANQLSGGEQQRVALARCLLRKAKLCLLDEPLSHLDTPLRTEVLRQIVTLVQQSGTTLLFVTHDPSEALAIGNRVAVMQEGRIVQLDEPAQLRRKPANRFVAELMHHDRGGLTWVTGELVRDAEGLFFVCPFGRWPFSQPDEHDFPLFLQPPGKLLSNNGIIHIIIGIPADTVACSVEPPSQPDGIRTTFEVVRQTSFTQGTWITGRNQQSQELIGKTNDQQHWQMGQVIAMTFSMQRVYGFDFATGQTLWVPSG